MNGLTIVSLAARRWQYATGGAGVALIVLLMWPKASVNSVVQTQLVRHDSVSRVEVAHVAAERVMAGRAKRKEEDAVGRATVLRARVDGQPDLAGTLLPDIVALQDTAIEWANVRAEHTEAALDVSELRASRLDSLVGLLRAARDDQCRIVRIIPCPTRKAIIAGALVATALANIYTRR
jgi:hypothetical protein